MRRTSNILKPRLVGYIIGFNEIKIDPERTQGIHDFPAPKIAEELRKFIGLLGYERRFLENISETLKPLYELTKKNVKFKWTESHQTAFEEAKAKLKKVMKLVCSNTKSLMSYLLKARCCYYH